MDILTILGLVTGITAILLGQHLEGGQLSTLINGPAMLIVLGGTLGAVMIQTPFKTFLRAGRMLIWVFVTPRLHVNEMIEQILEWSHIARKDGLLGLEHIDETHIDEFAYRGLQLVVDGNDPGNIRNVLDLEISNHELRDIQCAKVFESMGGYSPTIGIIGAVLGLIQVMGNLSDPSKLGDGIAVAFVATIYGVGAANLVFIPIANKLKALVQRYTQYRELIVEGIVAISEGENPRNIEIKLHGFLR
ncbi:MAG: flagellar motor protein [Gammaproteobacteria bacterium]|nr:flagellar motor protein [Gammaproteobacteria bacterium]